jgi:hypothetical protein
MCEYNFDEIPNELMDREEPSSITLRELFEYDKVTKSYTKFDARARSTSKLLYRIPEHQRFPQWNKPQKLGLIDTVLRNYTMSGIVLSEKIVMKNGKIVKYYDIEDGQSRLSILQDFHACRFDLPTMGIESMTFDTLDLDIQNRFLDYKITKEIIKNKARSLEEYEDNIHEMFERLQGGKRLTDDDKYWNRNTSPLVDLAISIIKTYGYDFNITKITSSSKKKKGLTNICGLIGGILYGDPDINIPEKNIQYSPAFRHQLKNISKGINTDNKKLVFKFIDYYLNIIREMYSLFPKDKNEKNLDFKNNAKYINMIMIDYKINNNKNKDIWIDFFINIRANEKFLNSIYNNLSSTQSRANSRAAIYCRLNRVKEFYRDKVKTSKEHGIVYTNIDY